jgi:hypothetical protein
LGNTANPLLKERELEFTIIGIIIGVRRNKKIDF